MHCPNPQCGAVIVECRSQVAKTIDGCLWGINPETFLKPGAGEHFSVKAMDENDDKWEWKEEHVHTYRCKCCAKAMALIAFTRLVPSKLCCIARFSSVVSVAHPDFLSWLWRIHEQRAQGRKMTDKSSGSRLFVKAPDNCQPGELLGHFEGAKYGVARRNSTDWNGITIERIMVHLAQTRCLKSYSSFMSLNRS